MKTRKPRSDSPLRMLPAPRQGEIMDYLQTHSAAETRAWLAQDGLVVSTGALSAWRSDYLLRSQIRQAELDAHTFMETARKNSGLKEAEIFAMGQQYFNLQAIKLGDDEMWARTQKTRQREDLIKIERQKVQRETCKLFIQWVEDEEAKKIATSTASNKEKIEALGKKMFGEDWE
jgi:hypothetical protein